MNFNIAYPSAALAPFVKMYWAIENVPDTHLGYNQRIIPSGLPELIFYFNVRPETSMERTFEGNSLLCVQQNDYYDLVIKDRLSVFSILFHPEGIRQFFRIPFHELYNKSTLLSHVNKQVGTEMEGNLAEACSFQQRVGIAESFLIKMLTDHFDRYDFIRMQHCVDLIRQSKGNLNIDFLAGEACLSRKQFERKFCDHIGATPKQYLKVIRFQSALFMKSRMKSKSLSALASECGYYDQSHLINDCKLFTGYTPKQLFDECDSLSDFFEC